MSFRDPVASRHPDVVPLKGFSQPRHVHHPMLCSLRHAPPLAAAPTGHQRGRSLVCTPLRGSLVHRCRHEPAGGSPSCLGRRTSPDVGRDKYRQPGACLLPTTLTPDTSPQPSPLPLPMYSSRGVDGHRSGHIPCARRRRAPVTAGADCRDHCGPLWLARGGSSGGTRTRGCGGWSGGREGPVDGGAGGVPPLPRIVTSAVRPHPPMDKSQPLFGFSPD